jgi:hypothetical protein
MTLFGVIHVALLVTSGGHHRCEGSHAIHPWR